LLSLLVGIANFCLATVLSKGYEISWWIQAVEGAELRKLHFDLDIQRRLSAIFSRNMIIDKFTIAAIVSLLVSVINGPLIQKASTITANGFPSSPFISSVEASVSSLPADFSSSRVGSGSEILTPLFGNVSRAYASRDNVELIVQHCGTNTTCEFTLPAPGLDISCVDGEVPFDFSEMGSAASGDQTYGSAPVDGMLSSQITTYAVDISFTCRGDFTSCSTINATILRKPDPACSGYVQRKDCVLRLATVEYPITLSNNVATLRSWRPDQNETIQILQSLDPDANWRNVLFTGPTAGYEPSGSMLGGFSSVLKGLYNSRLALRILAKGSAYAVNGTGQTGNTYVNSDLSTYGFCNMTWGDPFVDIVNTARELMFRSTIAYSKINQTAVMQQQLQIQRTESLVCYKSHYVFLFAALGFMLLQALIVTFLLLRWQILGRELSLDPFEIAWALDAPLLRSGSAQSNIRHVLSPMWTQRLRYGEILPRETVCSTKDIHDQRTSPEAHRSTMLHEAVHLIGHNSGFDRVTFAEHEHRLGLDLENKTMSLSSQTRC
jgi:hypothetical protein